MSIPGEGQLLRQLRGFGKVMVQPEEAKTFVFELRGTLCVWDGCNAGVEVVDWGGALGGCWGELAEIAFEWDVDVVCEVW